MRPATPPTPSIGGWERQGLVRDRAYRVAYYALTIVFGGLSLLVMYAAGNDEGWPALRETALFLPWLTFLSGSLPTAVVAWTTTDDARRPHARPLAGAERVACTRSS